MRLHIKLTKNTSAIHYDYQYILTRQFHKWLGKNSIHDSSSLYSFSWIQGDYEINNGLMFTKSPSLFISFHDNKIGEKIIAAIQNDPEFIFGMKVKEIVIQDTPEFSDEHVFLAASPIFIRAYDEKFRAEHLTFKNSKSGVLLTQTMRKKMDMAGIQGNIDIQFDKNYHNPKSKLIDIKGIKNKANLCPVIIKGDPEAIQFAWNVGVGHLTGCGFGAIK